MPRKSPPLTWTQSPINRDCIVKLRVTDDEHYQLSEAANADHRTVSGLVRHALAMYFDPSCFRLNLDPPNAKNKPSKT